MLLLIIWLIAGCYGLVENADIIAEVENKKLRFIGMAIITISTPFYMIISMFDYMLEQIFGDSWGDDDEFRIR